MRTKEIEGFEHYLIQEDGYVINSRFNKLLKPTINQKGVVKVTLFDRGRQKTVYPAREVAKAFVPNPCRFKFVKHLNGDKRDCCVDNMTWVKGRKEAA